TSLCSVDSAGISIVTSRAPVTANVTCAVISVLISRAMRQALRWASLQSGVVDMRVADVIGARGWPSTATAIGRVGEAGAPPGGGGACGTRLPSFGSVFEHASSRSSGRASSVLMRLHRELGDSIQRHERERAQDHDHADRVALAIALDRVVDRERRGLGD